MAARSRMRCGRFPVFSSCSMTPTTMSSLIPSMSTLRNCGFKPGEGGGVCSTAGLLLANVAAGISSSAGEPTFERGDETGERGSSLL